MTIKERIAELREIEAAATPIPFEVCKYNPRIVEVKGQCRAAGNLADCQNANDAAFIATARGNSSFSTKVRIAPGGPGAG